jgi:hypothetical protein
MRRKFALLAVLAAALAVPSMAAASAGTLTGVGAIGGATPFDLGVGMSDGGATFFGLENDRSGNCNGDSGTVTINGALVFNIVCAHFVASSRCCNIGSPKMRFAWGSGPYNVARITDNGLNLRAPTDTFAVATVNTLAEAIAWVNTGAVGSGNAGGWDFRPVLINSDYAVS